MNQFLTSGEELSVPGGCKYWKFRSQQVAPSLHTVSGGFNSIREGNKWELT
jgi:hypothetical protein